MQKLNKSVAFMAAVAILLIALIATLLGSKYLLISSVNHVRLAAFSDYLDSKNLTFLLRGIVLHMNMMLLITMCSNNYTKKAVVILIFTLPLTICISTTIYQVAPILFMFFATIALKNNMSFCRTVLNFAEIQIIIILYQLVSMYVKTHIIQVEYLQTNSLSNIILNIDLLIFKVIMLLLCKEGGGKYVVRMVLLSIREGARNLRAPKIKTAIAQGLSGPDRMIYTLIQFAQFTTISVAVMINQRLIVFFVVYILGFLPQVRLGKDLQKYHAESLVGCFVQSLIAFYTVCAVLPSIRTSLLLPILGGAFLALGVSHYATARKKSPAPISETELRARCVKVKLSPEFTNRAIDYYIANMNIKDVAEKYNIGYEAAKKSKIKIKKALDL